MRMKKLFMLLAFILTSFVMFAQVTTSGLNGRVVGKDNISLPGATVTAIHVPSGTKYATITNKDGRFLIQGMRNGGPYKIEMSFIGFSKSTYNDITLNLGELFSINTELKESNQMLNEVVIIGAKLSVFNSERNGASININNKQISMIPTVSRSINDITRLTPQANGNQIGGGNYRQNYITVDGAQFNNAFGIGGNLPGNGSPISIDALDQISVNITPFDIRQSGFIGASVNAVTRSGNNDFSASVYNFMKNEKYMGNKVGDAAPFTRNPSDYNLKGFRIGGPILKNKLFFFINYETEKNTVPGPPRVASTGTPDYTNNIARPTVTDMDMISKYLSDTYGYETGPYQGYSQESPRTKFLTRLDWNISKNHKLNVRYSNSNGKSPSYPSTSYSPFASNQIAYTGNRQAMDAMWYKNSGYYQETNFSSLSTELNSTFGGGKYTNTLRYTYSYQDEPRSTVGKLFPFVDIMKDGKAYVSFGTELFSLGNLRQVKTTTISDDFTWTMGKNNFTLGAQIENNTTKNGYMRFASSFYVFNSWTDFTSGALPKNFGVTFSNTPGYSQAFPSFNFNQLSGYLQDEINVNSKLKITAGFRVDRPTYPDQATAHPIIAGLTFGDNKFNTATLPKSRLMLSPRIGFNYDINGDHSLVLRGGSGVFTGRIPFVWIVSQIGDAGMLQTTQTFTGTAVPGPFNPDINKYYPETQPAVGTLVPSSFTIISDNFKMPQTWKSSIAIDAKLPFGLKGTLEGIYNKDFNSAFFENAGLKGGVPMNIAGYPDNRIIYPTTNTAKYYNMQTGGIITTNGTGVTPIVMKNTNGGYYYSITAKIEKSFNKGFYAMFAATHSEAKNLVDGSGDQPFSAWGGNYNINGSNDKNLSYASYVTPTKLISALSYKKEYLKHMATAFSIFYEGGAQGRFSYTYSSNIVRDGGAYNLIYVPKDASEITFIDQTVNGKVWTAAEQSASFFAYVDQDKYLKTRKGQYAERNGVVTPWRNVFDVKLTQDFYINVCGKRNTLQFSLDILNVGNLLNKNWGLADYYNQSSILVNTNNSSVVAGGTTKPTFKLNPYNNAMLTNTYSNNVGYGSTYSMQFGIRYIFN